MNLLLAPIEQVVNSPGSPLIIIFISMAAYAWDRIPKFSNVWLLPLCMVIGLILYPLVSKTSSVPDTFPYPIVVLLLNGAITGFIAFLGHNLFVKALINWMIGKVQDLSTKGPPPPPTPPEVKNSIEPPTTK